MGEILTKYLSKNFKDLDYMLYKCRNYVKDLHYPEDIAEGRVCDEMFHSAMVFYSEVENLMFSLPPYNSMNLQKDRLFDLLNEYDWFWTDEGNDDYYERDFTEHFNVDITLDDFNNTATSITPKRRLSLTNLFREQNPKLNSMTDLNHRETFV